MQSQASGSATRAGMIAGALVGMCSLPIIALSAIGGIGAPIGLMRIGFLVVAAIAFAAVGFIASRRSGLTRSGAWAGFLGGLLAAFIMICMGVVIVLLLAPHVAPLGHAPRASGRALRLLVRVAFVRLVIEGLVTLGCGVVAGFIGGALGRQAHPHSPAPAGYADAQPTQAYVAPTPPPPAMHDYAAVYTPDPSQPMTPVYDDTSPTVERNYQG